MDLSRQRVRLTVSSLAALTLLAAAGCASPGPPRAPSLHLPTPVTDLTAMRTGDSVELRFTLPTRSTDKLPLPPAPITISVCRALDHEACVRIPSLTVSGTSGAAMDLRDELPANLAAGGPGLLAYRVELSNASGHSAGKSDAAFTAAGQALSSVEGLRAEGSRLGVVLRWNGALAEDGQILLRREQLSPPGITPAREPSGHSASSQPALGMARQAALRAPRKPVDEEPRVVWLVAGDGQTDRKIQDDRTLDTSAVPDVPYRYKAVRRRIVLIGGRSLELRSGDSKSVEFTLREIYPPPAPTALLAAGFLEGTPTPADNAPQKFAVDLIWQPVDDPNVAGYNVYRQTVDPQGSASGNRTKLNSSPVPLPGFHDPTASAATRYEYGVTAVDGKGNESAAATTVLEPRSVP